MRYYVQDRGDQLSIDLSQQFHALAKEEGFKLDAESPEIVISIGGDGTMLQAFHNFIDRIPDIAFVGVHTGHLGFYADWKKEELRELVRLMSGKGDPERLKPRIVEYPLLELEIRKKSGNTSYIALNEFTLKGVDGTVVAQVDINDVTFEMFRETVSVCRPLQGVRHTIRRLVAPWYIPQSKLFKSPRSLQSITASIGRWVHQLFCPSIIIVIYSHARISGCCLPLTT